MTVRSTLFLILAGSLAFGLIWYLALALLPYQLQLVLFPKQWSLSWAWPAVVPFVTTLVVAGRVPALSSFRAVLGVASAFIAFVGGIISYVILCNISPICM